MPLVQHPIQSVRKGHRAKYWIRSLFPPPLPGERAVMQTPTPLPSPSPGNTSCPGSRLLPCWPWTAQNSTLSLHVLETHALFPVFSSFIFSISCLFYSVIPLGSSSAAANYLLLLVTRPSSAATNCISRCIHVRSQTSGYFLQPASQPDTRIRSPERRIERNSKKQKGSQKKKVKKVNRDSARSSLIGPPHEQGVISASYHQGSQPRNRVEKPAGQLSCSSSSRCFFFFGSSAFSSLVTAAPVRSTAAGAAALLYLYNCWFHGPARFSSMHPSSSRCMVAASTHACMPQQNPRKEQPGDGPQSSTSQKWELIIRQPPFPSPPLKPMSIGIICLVWPLKPQGSIRFLSTPPAHHTLLRLAPARGILDDGPSKVSILSPAVGDHRHRFEVTRTIPPLPVPSLVAV